MEDTVKNNLEFTYCSLRCWYLKYSHKLTIKSRNTNALIEPLSKILSVKRVVIVQAFKRHFQYHALPINGKQQRTTYEWRIYQSPNLLRSTVATLTVDFQKQTKPNGSCATTQKS